MREIFTALLGAVLVAPLAHAALQPLNAPVQLRSTDLPNCGDSYAPPFADGGAATTLPRACAPVTQRSYVPRHHGLAYEILMMESEACFVSDDSFRLLDSLIDQARDAIAFKVPAGEPWPALANSTLATIGDVLAQNGFQLYIPTNTLGDALIERPMSNGGKHILDCDTSSFIYLGVTEEPALPVNLVEITLSSGAGHNYLRWTAAGGRALDWDTNGRAQCKTPSGLAAWQGRSLSRTEVLGYSRSLRASLWERDQRFDRAVVDYREAISQYPSGPTSYNNFAWLVATKSQLSDPQLLAEAMTATKTAVSIERSANYLDTLACMYARVGDFANAIVVQEEALSKSPGNADLMAHMAAFRSTPSAKTCVGM